MDAISDIKNRLPIEQLVGQYVQLKKVGRNFKALCPFHKERTPSFYVSPEKQLAYCFGCQKGGDHFKFIEEIEGLDFRGALKFLAEKAGVQLPKIVPEDKQKKSERDRLIEMHEIAAAFFEKELKDSDEGLKTLAYLKKRGLKEETVKNARLGYAPKTGSSLYNYLLGKGFTRGEILSAGLVVARSTEQGDCADRFRGRLMFPIRNLAGGICAFGGRALSNGDEPKYLNSPETPIYFKSSLLYGLGEARQEIRNKNAAILVEGYMDAISAHQAGFKNTVACGGTSLTESQLNILKRFTRNVFFAFDRDTAGKMATERAISLGLSQEANIKIVVWKSPAKDPDECLKKDPEIFAVALQSAKNAISYLAAEFQENNEIGSVEGKKSFIEMIVPILADIASPVELDCWVKEISNLIEIPATVMYEEIKRHKKSKQKFPQKTSGQNAARPEKTAKSFQTEEYLIGILLTYPETYNVVNQLVTSNDFDDKELQNIYIAVTSKYNQSLGEDFDLKRNLSPEQFARANILAMFAESSLADMNWEALEREVRETIRTLKQRKLENDKRELHRKLKNAKGAERTEILESFQDLLNKNI